AWMAWTEAAAGRRRALNLAILGISLAAGLWNHYFAALVYAPIAVGELVRTIRSRRIGRPLWIAVALSLVAVLPLYRLLRLSASQSGSFWSRPSIHDIPATYTFLYGSLLESPFNWALAAILILVAIARFHPEAREPRPMEVPPHEIAAAI